MTMMSVMTMMTVMTVTACQDHSMNQLQGSNVTTPASGKQREMQRSIKREIKPSFHSFLSSPELEQLRGMQTFRGEGIVWGMLKVDILLRVGCVGAGVEYWVSGSESR